jgi:Na+/proline symporter
MSPALILACVGGYFGFLLLIAWFTSRNASNASYFLGNKASPWYAVAFGLIGDSLSGVTFISVPGKVAADQFSYLQIVFGYVLRLRGDRRGPAAALLPAEPHLHL